MATIDEIKEQAATIKGETAKGANTAARIGGLFGDLAEWAEGNLTAKHYKGTVETTSDLPTTATAGDVYQVTEDGKFYAYQADGTWKEGDVYTNISELTDRVKLVDTDGFWLWAFTDADGAVVYGQTIKGEIINYRDTEARKTTIVTTDNEEETPATVSLASMAAPASTADISTEDEISTASADDNDVTEN